MAAVGQHCCEALTSHEQMLVSLCIEYDANATMWGSFGYLHFWWHCGPEDAQDAQQVLHQWIRIREQASFKFKSIGQECGKESGSVTA